MKLCTPIAALILANGASAFVPRSAHRSSWTPTLLLAKGKFKAAKEKRASASTVGTKEDPSAVSESVTPAMLEVSSAEAEAKAALQKKNELAARLMMATRFEMEKKVREAKAAEAALALAAKKAAEEVEAARLAEAKAREEALAAAAKAREEALAAEAKAREEALAAEEAARKAAEKEAADNALLAHKKKQEQAARALLENRLTRQAKFQKEKREYLAAKELRKAQIEEYLRVPKTEEEKAAISARYVDMTLEEKCFQIMYDMGLVEISPDQEGTYAFDGDGPEDYVYS